MNEYIKFLNEYLQSLSEEDKEKLQKIVMEFPDNENTPKFAGKIFKCCIEGGWLVCKMRYPDEC